MLLGSPSATSTLADRPAAAPDMSARLRFVDVAKNLHSGVATTSSGYRGGRMAEQAHTHVAGRGVFMEELLAELERRGVHCRAEEAEASAGGQ